MTTNSKRRYLPFAFTEQGIYMLMTVLRGDLAVRQSKTLIRLFKSMKDYIVETQSLGSTNEVLALANQVRTNKEKISKIEGKLDMLMDNFIDPSTYKSFLIMDGEKVESDVAYQRIYSMANQSVYLIEDYIDVKTIRLLKSSNHGIGIVEENRFRSFSENWRRHGTPHVLGRERFPSFIRRTFSPKHEATNRQDRPSLSGFHARSSSSWTD